MPEVVVFRLAEFQVLQRTGGGGYRKTFGRERIGDGPGLGCAAAEISLYNKIEINLCGRQVAGDGHEVHCQTGGQIVV